MQTRKVKWLNTTKGFRFNAPNDGGPHIFFHISAVEQSGLTGLADDQPIRCQLVEGQDGQKLAGELEMI
jgi:CspA family cold shock protein